MTQATGQGSCQKTECYGYAKAAHPCPGHPPALRLPAPLRAPLRDPLPSSQSRFSLCMQWRQKRLAKNQAPAITHGWDTRCRESTAYWDSSVLQAFLTC